MSESKKMADRPEEEDAGLNKKADERDGAGYYDESETSSVEILTGVSKVEAAQAVW